jgi:hypothetical protein
MEDKEYEEIVDAYLGDVLDAFQKKASGWYGASASLKERFQRASAIKDALKLMDNRGTFGIASSDYLNCPDGKLCCGGVCVTGPCPQQALADLETRFKPPA